DGWRRAGGVSPRPGGDGRVRTALRGVPPAPRPLRSRRQRGDATAARAPRSDDEGGHVSELDDAIAAIRTQLTDLHAELPRHGLVAWTSGNVSARVPGASIFAIKPSGVGYDELTPEAMVLCDLDGVPVPG